MRRLNSAFLLIFILLLFLTHVSRVSASEIVTDECLITRSVLDWRIGSGSNTVKDCSINRFDPSLGILQRVNLVFAAETDTIQKVENKDATPHQMTSSVTVNLNAKSSDESNDLITLSIPAALQTFKAAEFDGTVDYAGDSGIVFEPQFAQEQNSLTYTEPSDLEIFAGTGELTFPVYAQAEWSCSGSGNAACEVDTFASARISVSYEYELHRPDLVINSCGPVDVEETSTSTYVIRTSNQGTDSTQQPVIIRDELPLCVEIVNTSGEGWTCDETEEGTMVCEFIGTVPPGASVPDLGVEINADQCEEGEYTHKITVETAGETATQNNSYNCSMNVFEEPEVLAEVTNIPTPTPTDQITPTVSPQVDEGNVLAATGVWIVGAIVVGGLLIGGVYWTRRRIV